MKKILKGSLSLWRSMLNPSLVEWLEVTKGINPPDQYDIHLHTLYSDGEKTLFTAWVIDEVPLKLTSDKPVRAILQRKNRA